MKEYYGSAVGDTTTNYVDHSVVWRIFFRLALVSSAFALVNYYRSAILRRSSFPLNAMHWYIPAPTDVHE